MPLLRLESPTSCVFANRLDLIFLGEEGYPLGYNLYDTFLVYIAKETLFPYLPCIT